jgi:glycosyltransferase involved in cell wall biosynthesis
MRVLLTSEARFERTRDGVVWGPAAYGSELWSRYLDVFSGVLVVARVLDVSGPSAGFVRASMRDVEFCRLPPYAGMSGLIRNLGTIRASVAVASRTCGALVLRAPSPVAFSTARAAAAARRPYGAELVGDPNQVFSTGAFRHPLRVPVRYLASAAQRRLSRNAVAVMFVTREALQRRYPTRGLTFATSDVALDAGAFSEGGTRDWRRSDPFRLVTVGALDQPYKGTAVLLDAVRELRRRGAPVTLQIVGTGRLAGALQRQSTALSISDCVEFRGQVDRPGLRRALDDAHLFVLPSLTEGLPRALLEAMARGLPAVATHVGGVPELLPSECLVPPRDSGALADRIGQLLHDDAARIRLGRRNREEARRHDEPSQTALRREFLRAVRDASRHDAPELRCA